MSQQGQPVSVLLHTVGYLLLHHAPSYYPLITYWVSGLLPASHLLEQYILRSGFHHAIDRDRNTHFSGAVLKLIRLPPKSLQASHSIPHNTHILLPRHPPTFHAIINPDFCRGGSSDLVRRALWGSIWKQGVTRWGKIGCFRFGT